MKKRLKIFFSIFFVILLVIFFHYLGWFRPVEDFLRFLIKPSTQFLYNISIQINNEEENFATTDDLKTAYKTVKEELLNQKIDTIKLKLLEDENIELKKQLNFASKNSFTQLGATVIGKNIDALGNNIIIDQGEVDGMVLDAPVIVSEGVLIGKIVRLEKNISVVRLINDNQSKIAVTVVNHDKSLGLIEGGYGISIRLNYVPQNEIINVGDIVITSGLESNVPAGLLVGTVDTVEKEAYQPFQQAVISPFVNLEKISLVAVIIKI